LLLRDIVGTPEECDVFRTLSLSHAPDSHNHLRVCRA